MAPAAKKRKATKRTKQSVRENLPSLRWSIAYACALLAIGWTGLAVVDSARETRTLYYELGEVQRKQDRLLEENSRLSLERSALSSLQKIEQVASEQLDMEFPQQIERGAP